MPQSHRIWKTRLQLPFDFIRDKTPEMSSWSVDLDSSTSSQSLQDRIRTAETGEKHESRSRGTELFYAPTEDRRTTSDFKRHYEDRSSRNMNAGYPKLFLGQVPPVCTESDVRQIMEPYGPLIEVALFRSKQFPDRGPYDWNIERKCAIWGRFDSTFFLWWLYLNGMVCRDISYHLYYFK